MRRPFCAVMAGPTDMAIYFDGVDVGGTYGGSGGPLAHSAYPLVVGRRSIYGDYFKGRLDEIRLYSRELGTTAIEDLAER